MAFASISSLHFHFPFTVENKTQCYGEIGCLDLTCEWFHWKYRLLYHFPSNRSEINTQFILYTESSPTVGQTLVASDPQSIFNSDFDPNRPTKFIIHGFIDSSRMKWVSEMRDELLHRGNLNVIVVDWSGGSKLLFKYHQAAVNTRLVGLEIAFLIRNLMLGHGLRAEDVHLIGHSLGAHTAGYAAERIPGVGRITGLDPAYPYFQEMSPKVRLDPTDATFVDVIHTDIADFSLQEMLGYGMSPTCGHVDFYPNDGKTQPGCGVFQGNYTAFWNKFLEDGIDEASKSMFACSHVRAIRLFTESINGECPFVGLYF